MSIFKQFATDPNKEAAGVKLEFGANSDGSIQSVTIRRAGKSNKRYAKVLETKAKPVRRQMELGTISDEAAEKLLREVFAEAVVIGWENIQPKDDGVNLPFTKENVISLFETLPEFYDEIQKQANNVSLFRAEALEDEAKN